MLTEEERKALLRGDYRQDWEPYVTNTDRLNPERAKEIVADLREHILKIEREVPTVIFPNPLDAWEAVCAVVTYEDQKKEKVPVERLTKEGVYELIKEMAEEYEEDFVPLAVSYVHPYADGSFKAINHAHYKISVEKGGEQASETYEKYWIPIRELGLIYPLDNVNILSEKPIEIHLLDEETLHRDGGPALAFDGGGTHIDGPDVNHETYALHGVEVPKEIVMTPAHEMTPEMFTKQKNVDVKAEVLRKMGKERLLSSYGKLIDSHENYGDPMWSMSEYKLYDLADIYPRHDYAPHLYMKNQTTGIYHIEGVSPNCRTLEEALKERMAGQHNNIGTIK